MTSREIVRNTIKFKGAPRLPHDFPVHYGYDTDFYGTGMSPSPDSRRSSGTDEWGSVWNNLGNTNLGEVKEFPIKPVALSGRYYKRIKNSNHQLSFRTEQHGFMVVVTKTAKTDSAVEKTVEKTENTVEKTVEKTESTVEKTENTVEEADSTVEKILEIITSNPQITQTQLVEMTGLTRRGIEWNLSKLKAKGLIERVGPDKGGYWKVLINE
jgi:predicted HTH transcriptional regulator